MNDKEKRLAELKAINFPSDQELEEITQLQEEINLSEQESKPIILPEEIPKPRKRSILEIIIQKIKKKPITWQDIERLKNEREVAYLKRDIAKANHERRNLKGGILGPNKPARKQRQSRGSNHRGSADGGLRKMIGTNDSRNYKDLTG